MGQKIQSQQERSRTGFIELIPPIKPNYKGGRESFIVASRYLLKR